MLGVVAADDVGEVGPALLLAGRDGEGVETSLGGVVDPYDLRPQSGDLAVGAADVGARRLAAGVVRSAAAAVARPVPVRVAQRGERVVVAGQEGFRVLVDLEARVFDERAELAFAEVGPGVAVGELGGRGAVAVGGRAADLLAGGETLASLGERLGQGQTLLLVEDLEHVGLGAA
ncbi:hypothetical protein [Streptomyces noursei]|uniref:hypothetical protein n=1 Tax=Streptomyces noursei TaxID=1971 RepID=UPI0022A6F7F3|nr:hypothetical protein [Streptomyces noursei]MCZ1021438.1 hypothetical protein [Streptomyces noursei]